MAKEKTVRIKGNEPSRDGPSAADMLRGLIAEHGTRGAYRLLDGVAPAGVVKYVDMEAAILALKPELLQTCRKQLMIQ